MLGLSLSSQIIFARLGYHMVQSISLCVGVDFSDLPRKDWVMAYRNKTYVCFDGDTDMHYYRLMQAWSENEKFSFNFFNAHDLNTARDDSQEESIKRQLRERFANSKDFVVLIGEKTRLLRKFVQWEMEVAIRLGLPIVAVNLNGAMVKDALCPPAIGDALAVFVPFKLKIVEYAMQNWPSAHEKLLKEGKSEWYVYDKATYQQLGL